MLFGGENIPDAYNANPEAALAFRRKLGDTFAANLSGSRENWESVVVIA